MATERELNILIKAKDMASKVLNQYEEQFNQIGKSLLAVGTAGAAGLGAAIKYAADFGSSMSRVGALSRASESDMVKLTQTAKDLGASTSFSASQAAEGMQYLAMAGFDVNETIDAMPGLLATAAAGQLQLGQTADIVSNILSGFQIEASETGRVADVLAATFTSSNTDLAMLGETMKYVAPIASAAGMSLEDMAAATGLMGNAGIQGSQAGTSLRAMIMRLQAPTDEAATAMKRLGIQVRDAEGNMKSFPDILAEFESGLSGASKETQDMAIKSIIGMEAAAGFQALLNEGSDTLRTYSGELQNAGGTAEQIASQQLNNLNGALTILKSGLEGVAIAIGSQFTPYLKMAAEFLTGMVEKFNALDPDLQRKIALFAAVGTGLSLLTGAILLIIPMLPALAAAFSALLGPVGLVIAAVIALAVTIYKNFDKIKAATLEMVSGWDQMYAQVVSILSNLKSQAIAIFNEMMSMLLPLVQMMWSQISNFINLYGSQILLNIQSTWTIVQSIITALLNAIVAVFEWAFPYIEQIIIMVMGKIMPFVIKTWQKIADFIAEILPPLVKIIRWAWEQVIQPLITIVMDRIWNVIQSVWTAISSFISNTLDVIMGIIKFALGVLTADWSMAWEGVKQTLSGALGLITETLWNFIGTLASIGQNIIMGLVDGVVAAAGALVDAVVGAVKGAIDAAKDFLDIRSPSRVMMEIGAYTGEGWIKGLQDQAREAAKVSENMAAMSVSPFEKAQISPGVYGGHGGSAAAGGSGSTVVNFNFGEGSVVLPEVKNGQEFADQLQAFSLRQAFKSQ